MLSNLEDMDFDLSITQKSINQRIDASIKSLYASARKGEPQPAEVYLAEENRRIEKGMLFGLGWNEQKNMPQWKLDMDKLFGEKQWLCAHTFKVIGDKKVFLYETKAYIELIDDGNIISEKSLYGASTQEKFIRFILDLPEGENYTILTCKSIDDDQAMQWYGDKGVVECLGIYTVDRVQSIIDNKLVLRLSNRMIEL